VRQLWQVPLFFTGLSALLGVALTRPLWHDAGAAHVQRALATARDLLEEQQFSLEQVAALVEVAFTRGGQLPARVGEAHFLLGSAFLRVGENAPTDQAANHLRQARRHLEQARTLGVPPADGDRLTYRLGKAWLLTDGDPRRGIEALSSAVETGADDRSEGYALLAEAYLRLDPPDYHAALEASRKQLAQPSISDVALARARLRCGELHFQLQQPEEAHRVLARIGPGAPHSILARARYLRAAQYQHERNWTEAAVLWQEILADPQEAVHASAHVHYHLGVCHRHLGRLPEAAHAWAEALPYGGVEAQAAALRLAEVRLESSKDPTSALGLFEQALQGVARVEEFHNPFISLAEAQGLFERGCRVYRDAGLYEQAQRLAQLYAKLASPRAAQALFGQAAEAWARAKRTQARGSTRIEEGAAGPHFREAAAAYVTAAAGASQPEEAEWLGRAATCYLEARDFEPAVAVLERFVKLEGVTPEKRGAAWYKLAEAHRALGHDAAAMEAFQRCISYPGPHAYRARYELALVDMERGYLDEAEATLQQNIHLQAPMPDAEADEKSHYALAGLLFRRKKFHLAEPRLEQALQLYPANPGALQARYQLGVCYAHRAGQLQAHEGSGDRLSEEVRANHRSRSKEWLEKATRQFETVLKALQERAAAQSLGEVEAALLRRVLLDLISSRYDLEMLNEAERLCQALLKVHLTQGERLGALRWLWTCQARMGRVDQARETLEQLRSTLGAMTDADFLVSSGPGSRLWWDKWLEAASRASER
jgi:tetratricopeptide (TPR) repeat protein